MIVGWMKRNSSVRVSKRHIASEWSESGTDDGYWISLKTGWKLSGDPVGAVHCIHEPTKTKAHKERVMPCYCSDCIPKPQSQ